MTDLVKYQQQPSLQIANDAMRLARTIASTELVPKPLRDRPEAVLACILTGHEVGLQPMQALRSIHMIDGRPSMSAEAMRGLIERHGHELNFVEVTTQRVVLEGRRAGSERWTRVEFTMDDAKRAKLLHKDNWSKWPRAMLVARATGELARMIFADVLAGIPHTTEELADMDEGETLAEIVDIGRAEARDVPAPEAPKAQTASAGRQHTRPDNEPAVEQKPPPARGPVPPLPGEDDDIIDAEVIEPDPNPPPPPAEDHRGPTLTGPQMIAIRMADKLGIRGNDDATRTARLEAIASILGLDEPLASSKDLSAEQIAEVLEYLNGLGDYDGGADAGGPTADVASQRPAEDAPPASVPSPASAPARKMPEQWSGDEWRDLLRKRKVKVTEALRHAHELGAAQDPKVPIPTLDDIAGSGIAEDLLGFVEDLAQERAR